MPSSNFSIPVAPESIPVFIFDNASLTLESPFEISPIPPFALSKPETTELV